MIRAFLALLVSVLLWGNAQAGTTFTNLPAANVPLSNTGIYGPTYVPLDQGSGCATNTSPCQTAQTDALRLGQPIQTNCLSFTPFQYQQCIDTTLSPPVLKEFIGSTWWPLYTLSSTVGPVPPTLPGVYAMFQNNIPFIIAPSGTIGANGHITLGTALPIGADGVYLYLPTNAINTGSTAGWYCAVIDQSGGTVGTVYASTPFTGGTLTFPYTSGQPYNCLTVGNHFIGTTGTSYTGVTSQVNGPTFSIPGNSQNNFTYRVDYVGSYIPNSDTKTLTVSYGGNTMGTTTTSSASIYGQQGAFSIWNDAAPSLGAVSVPISNAVNITTPGVTRAAVDMTANQNLTITMQMSSATDYVILEHVTIQEIQGP